MNAEPSTPPPREIQWRCTACLHPNSAFAEASAAGPWTCEECGESQPGAADGFDDRGGLGKCLVCGCPDLYRQRDFNRRLGVGIIVVGAVLAVALGLWVRPALTFVTLIAFAAVDIAIYRFVPEAVICYHCQSIFRGYPSGGNAEPFDLDLSDKYLETERRRGW